MGGLATVAFGHGGVMEVTVGPRSFGLTAARQGCHSRCRL
ncbi:hypothetical protein RHCRD62_100086 [Rhodococcus sp. RD6.2]|nr:hypothetical protein RHCRD62_100086 [Rhodococcus sp. RD6.2]